MGICIVHVDHLDIVQLSHTNSRAASVGLEVAPQ